MPSETEKELWPGCHACEVMAEGSRNGNTKNAYYRHQARLALGAITKAGGVVLLPSDREHLERRVAEALGSEGDEEWLQHDRHTFSAMCVICRGDVKEIARIALDAILGTKDDE